MMITVKGTAYSTIVDAAMELGVSTKTVRQYIQKGIIPHPPEFRYGVRMMTHFPPDYIEQAKKLLENYRTNRNAGR